MKIKYTCTAIFLIFLIFSSKSWSNIGLVKIIDNFEAGISSKWQVKSFKDYTHYTAVIKDKQTCLEAKSNGGASGLIYKIDYSSEEYPILTWKWQINNIINNGDVTKKEGDDYPARIYVVFPNFLFWKTKSINYIWANKAKKGSFTPSPYTKNSVMIAVESGAENIGKWLTEERNIHEDFIKSFGSAPPQVGAIAIMTDTDNTGENALAWYGPISIKDKNN